MRVLRLVLLLLAFPGMSSAKIYRWVDEQGVEHFSDKPKQGSQEIQLPDPGHYKPSPSPKRKPQKPIIEERAEYESLAITEPTQNATVRNNAGRVSVSVTTQPNLHAGHKLQLLLDGRRVGRPSATTQFVLLDVYRGAHTLAAIIIDAKGKTLHQSDAVRFYMHRNRQNMIPDGANRQSPQQALQLVQRWRERP